jgi:hypothetical protein
VINEGALPVDLDDGQPLPMRRLEIGIAADVHLDQLELALPADLLERGARTLAETTLRRVIERDHRALAGGGAYGYSPRVVVASETRLTARP